MEISDTVYIALIAALAPCILIVVTGLMSAYGRRIIRKEIKEVHTLANSQLTSQKIIALDLMKTNKILLLESLRNNPTEEAKVLVDEVSKKINLLVEDIRQQEATALLLKEAQ